MVGSSGGVQAGISGICHLIFCGRQYRVPGFFDADMAQNSRTHLPSTAPNFTLETYGAAADVLRV